MKSMCRLLFAEIFRFSFIFKAFAVIACDPGRECWWAAPTRVRAAWIFSVVLLFDRTSTEMNADRPQTSSLGIKAPFAQAECVSLSSLFLSGIRRHRVLFYSGIFWASWPFSRAFALLGCTDSDVEFLRHLFNAFASSAFIWRAKRKSLYEIILFVDTLKA